MSYEGLCRLQAEGFEVSTYCDSNPEKWGSEFNGKTVIQPDELVNYDKVCVLISAQRITDIDSIVEKLRMMGIEYYLMDEVILKMHGKEVMECYDLLDDKISKKVYAEIVMKHIQGMDVLDHALKETDPYFGIDEFAFIGEDVVFVDCGAYVGDTIERFIWKRDGVFKKIIAFEPDKDNYKAMEIRLERLRKEWNLKEGMIEAFPFGIADKNGTGIFESYEANNGLGSKFIEGRKDDDSIRVISLDEYLSEPYTFLKADIESYEYKMLLGAKNGIKKWKPLIAVCIYHSAVDLYSIPLLIKSIESNYKMAVRHYSNTLVETILYCWC